ncbi:hypothetical protein GCM10027020_24710 [Nocardioides salsibiostraticola]
MIDTAIEGDPAQIEEAATFLRVVVAGGATGLADSSARQRNQLTSGWEGEAGTAFGDRARLLSTCGDDLGAAAERTARALESLATGLRIAQAALLAIRREALESHLLVTGTVVRAPLNEAPVGMAFGPDSTFAALQRRHDLVVSTWDQALELTAVEVRRNAETLTLATANLMSVAYTTYLVGLNSSILRRHAEHFGDEALRLRAQVAAQIDRYRDGRVRIDLGEYDELMDRIHTAQTLAQDSATATHEAPRGIGRIGGALGLITGAYAVALDMQDGESATQAVVSQGTGWFTGLATGAGVGSLFPVPVVGAVVGGVTGLVVAVAADKSVDRVFEGPPDKNPPRPSTMGQRVLSEDESRIAVLLGGNPEVEPPGFYPRTS